jgi:hypothetical protein
MQASASVALTAAPVQQFFNITISPASVSVEKGQTRQFSVNIDTNITSASRNVTWSVIGATHSTISAGGLLTVPVNEPANSIIVRVTAVHDGSHSQSSVTLTAAPVQQFFNINISPVSANVARNSTRQFTAAIDTNIPSVSHSVTWSVHSSGNHRSTINANGLLSVPNNENQISALTVRATAAHNGAQANASVTVG